MKQNWESLQLIYYLCYCYFSCLTFFCSLGLVTTWLLWPHGLHSPPGFSVHRTLQAKIPEWVAIFPSPFVPLSVQSLSPVSFVSDSLRPHEYQHARPPCPSPSPGVHSNSRPSSPWCHPAISSSVVPFSFCPQSLPSSESFPMSQLFSWGGQSIGISALGSFLPKNTQGWSPLERTGWISLQFKGLSRVFSNTTVQKLQFFSAQLSSQSNSHIHTWPLCSLRSSITETCSSTSTAARFRAQNGLNQSGFSSVKKIMPDSVFRRAPTWSLYISSVNKEGEYFH